MEEIAIIDLDGTICEIGDRNVYDASKCNLDTVIKHTADIVYRLFDEGINIAFITGRPEEYRKETEKWLHNNGFFGGTLFMRPNGDKRKDFALKKEIYDEKIKGKYRVKLVLDDRLGPCKMWHEEGLPLLRVGDPEFKD